MALCLLKHTNTQPFELDGTSVNAVTELSSYVGPVVDGEGLGEMLGEGTEPRVVFP